MTDSLKSTGVQLPEHWYDKLDQIAEETGTTRSAVIRAAIDTGLRGRKYYSDLELNPEQYHHKTIAELKEDRYSD